MSEPVSEPDPTIVVDVPRPDPRPCAGCDTVDTDPRCVSAALVGEEAPPVWHHDCHARVGCPTCIAIVRAANGATGDALLAYKVANLTLHAVGGFA